MTLVSRTSTYPARRPSRRIRRIFCGSVTVFGVTEQPVAVEAAGSKLLPLRLTVGAEAAPPGTHKVELHVRAVEDATVARDEHTTFILPKP